MLDLWNNWKEITTQGEDMAFNFNQINLDALASMPTRVKEAFPEDYKKWEALNKAMLNRIVTGESKQIIINGTVFEVKEISR